MDNGVMSIVIIGFVVILVYMVGKAADGAGFDAEMDAQRRWNRWYED